MATLPPQTQEWPSDRAVLFVHGVGNASPGDYDSLVAQMGDVLGDDARQFAFYFLYYDQINDWFSTKTQAGSKVASLVTAIRSRLDSTSLGSDPTSLGNVIADFAGDVVWPVLLAEARQAVRAAYLQQLQQMLRDGMRSGVAARDQRISIICHSLGCFHTYEVLHHAAANPLEGLGPAVSGLQFANVIFMASPVQLIRTVAGVIPQAGTLFTVSGPSIVMPSESNGLDGTVPSARRTVSITGNLDPVGGFFFRKRAEWAYMALPNGSDPEQLSLIDAQRPFNVDVGDEHELTALLNAALRERTPPSIAPDNPHAWGAYVARHADDLRRWLVA